MQISDLSTVRQDLEGRPAKLAELKKERRELLKSLGARKAASLRRRAAWEKKVEEQRLEQDRRDAEVAKRIAHGMRVSSRAAKQSSEAAQADIPPEYVESDTLLSAAAIERHIQQKGQRWKSRSECLGTDRYHNRYWLLPSNDDNRSASPEKLSLFFIEHNKTGRFYTYQSRLSVPQLISALLTKGSREHQLRARLIEQQSTIEASIDAMRAAAGTASMLQGDAVRLSADLYCEAIIGMIRKIVQAPFPSQRWYVEWDSNRRQTWISEMREACALPVADFLRVAKLHVYELREVADQHNIPRWRDIWHSKWWVSALFGCNTLSQLLYMTFRLVLICKIPESRRKTRSKLR